jgi:hypothetical protein
LRSSFEIIEKKKKKAKRKNGQYRVAGFKIRSLKIIKKFYNGEFDPGSG